MASDQSASSHLTLATLIAIARARETADAILKIKTDESILALARVPETGSELVVPGQETTAPVDESLTATGKDAQGGADAGTAASEPT